MEIIVANTLSFSIQCDGLACSLPEDVTEDDVELLRGLRHAWISVCVCVYFCTYEDQNKAS